ncbi:MAG: HlyD family type I secretion periplasmic adaptor subunit [Devosia sp.]
MSDSARSAIVTGLIVLALFFGGFGLWSALSPLDGAVVGEGVVTVEGNRKSIDSLDGGIVREVLVVEGQHVAVGDVLLVLDDGLSQAQVDIYAQQFAVALATQARLEAELSDAKTVIYPDGLGESQAGRAAIAAQDQEFSSRRTALDGQVTILTHRVNELTGDLAAKRSGDVALRAQLASVQGEASTLRDLLLRGLTIRSRVLDLEREASALEAQVAENVAAISAAEQNIAETQQQIAQLGNDRRADVASQLNATKSRILDLTPSLANATATLERLMVRSPYEGKVLGLQVFSQGAVIAPGGKIADIVPDETALFVETRVRVEDVSDLKVGAEAEIHLTSHRQMYVPVLTGHVASVSADRLTDARTGFAYYAARVEVDPDELAATPDVALYPGMPASVMIITERRTALQYLLGPLFASFDGAFRQN